MVKLLSWLSPWWRYIQIVILVAVFGAGVWVTRMHYEAKIDKIEQAATKALLNYTNRIIEKDNEYREDLNKINSQLRIVQRQLKNEVSKPEYNCPIPDTGIGLLNNTIRAGRDKEPSK